MLFKGPPEPKVIMETDTVKLIDEFVGYRICVKDAAGNWHARFGANDRLTAEKAFINWCANG